MVRAGLVDRLKSRLGLIQQELGIVILLSIAAGMCLVAGVMRLEVWS